MNSIQKFRRAFTLIELLIVVAIIAILAAIAVPNFLEAQTRSKVSKVKADMRSLATAIEAYAVDHNNYPFYKNPQDFDFPNYDRSAPGSLMPGRFERRLPITLTTPIAYMTTLLLDLFPNQNAPEADEKIPHPYHYSTDQDNSANPGAAPGLDQYPVRALYSMITTGTVTGAPYANDSVIWMMLSHGPDIDHDNPDDGFVPSSYDPTNGTISSGDIYYFGPGIGPK